jgi:small subunit ribosomal protein S6
METAYEAVFITDAALAQEQADAVVNKYTGVITTNGGEIDDVDRWEPRRLAYEIKGRREGLYMIVNFRSEPAAKDELDRIFRISDDTLRHIIVKQDPKADRFPSKARAAEMERREREFAARAAAAPPTPSASETEQPVTDLSASAGEAGVTANGADGNGAAAAVSEPDVEEAPAPAAEAAGNEA